MFRFQSITCRVVLCLILIGSCAEAQQIAALERVDFDTHVVPILVSHCLECHSGSEPAGSLSLQDSASAIRGGDSGTVIVQKDSSKSLFWSRIETNEMPPQHPLGDTDKSIIKRWIDEGATWGAVTIDRFAVTTASRGGRDWWSLQRLQNVPPPILQSNWIRNAIDAFILQRLTINRLQPSPEAEPQDLIRRLYFDLIGLPPSPQQVAEFVADPSDKSYRRIVDELLASQHYGERWARHWLDVVRFGESNGFERNFPRENAWPYRDWVINALNQDIPYDEFARMQLIGDQVVGGIDGASATGFWVAGVHNTTVGGSKRMKELARQDEIEDVLATLGQTFLGLTVNCARCHDHKFDPISQTEYYQLASVISGLDFGDSSQPLPAETRRLESLNQQLNSRQQELSEIDRQARQNVLAAREASKFDLSLKKTPPAFAQWEFDDDLCDSVGDLHGVAHGSARVENGALILDGNSYVQTSPIGKSIAEKTLAVWVQLDDLDQRGGAAMTVDASDRGVFDAIVFAEREQRRWMAGSNNFARYDSFAGAEEFDAVNHPVHVAVVFHQDGSIEGYRDGVPYGKRIRQAALVTYDAGHASVLFGLRHQPAGGNRLLRGKLYQAALYDRALSPEEVAAAAKSSSSYVTEQQLVESLTPAQRDRRQDLKSEVASIRSARDEQAKHSRRNIFTLTTSAAKVTNVLLRGDPDNVGEVVSPAAVSAISGLASDFGLQPDAPEPDRRRKLADWVTDRNNPLLSRVIVNRVWHYHFGVGIVDTPNDLGFNGGRPVHPELLEYLAWNFRDSGYQMKPLHRLVVTSSTYRQATDSVSTQTQKEAEAIDADNRWLWRGATRRLEAEAVRDAMLCVSGKLNSAMGGPSLKDVSVIENNGTTYYEPIDVDGSEFCRRTVYRFSPRGGRSSLLDTFDCPDPAATAPRRTVTTTPLQALSLMNNAFVLRMARYFAERVQNQVGDDIDQQVTTAWQLAIARNPTPEGCSRLGNIAFHLICVGFPSIV